jgi:hypothetical protein
MLQRKPNTTPNNSETVRQTILKTTVKDVEEFRAEVEPQLFGQWKLPLNGEVDLGGSEAAQHIAAEIALPAVRWSGESGLVEDLVTRVPQPIEYERHA